MTTVIRGVIPYISASTLKHSERENPTERKRRELTFLFTDMRGFTTLCEGQSPGQGGGDAQPLPGSAVHP